MKTVKMLLKNACRKQVFTLTAFWMMYLGVALIVQANGFSELYSRLFFTFLIVWSIGYLFSISARFAKGEENPLQAISGKPTFIYGVRILTRLIFIFVPLIFIGVLLNINPALFDKYFRTTSLIYIVLVVSPYLLFITANSDKTPWIKGFWTFIKKNMSNAFAFIFWLSLSFVLFSYGATYIFFFSISIWTELMFSFMLFVLFIWVLVFCAILLGYFTKKSLSALNTPIKEDKLEQK